MAKGSDPYDVHAQEALKATEAADAAVKRAEATRPPSPDAYRDAVKACKDAVSAHGHAGMKSHTAPVEFGDRRALEEHHRAETKRMTATAARMRAPHKPPPGMFPDPPPKD